MLCTLTRLNFNGCLEAPATVGHAECCRETRRGLQTRSRKLHRTKPVVVHRPARLQNRQAIDTELAMTRRCLWFLACLWIIVCAGCVGVRQFPAPNLSPSLRLIDLALASENYQPTHPGRLPMEGARGGRPSHVLVLSSGGTKGAFSAGFLNGWTESGARPQFDVVTGVSTGALIAPLAFLGAECDGDLERIYTSPDAAQFYRRRPLVAVPWSDALADSEPLRQRIAREITEAMLLQIAREHRRGRRLFVGTTNLDSQRLIIWDMGAIAASDNSHKLTLFRDVLLASCSVPGLLPPVPINITIDGQPFTELHADGGVVASLFLLPQMLAPSGVEQGDPSSEHAVGTNVYVVVADKAVPDPAPLKSGVFQVSGASLRGLMQAQMESDLQRVYLLTLFTRSHFRLAAIPQHVTLNLNPVASDTETMRQLFAVGRDVGRSGAGWRNTPPGIEPGEWPTPRTGVSFFAFVPW